MICKILKYSQYEYEYGVYVYSCFLFLFEYIKKWTFSAYYINGPSIFIKLYNFGSKHFIFYTSIMTSNLYYLMGHHVNVLREMIHMFKDRPKNRSNDNDECHVLYIYNICITIIKRSFSKHDVATHLH